jgi:hypothetical protein
LTKGVRSEEKLVSSLSAGQDLSRFRATLGTPDRKRPAGEVLVYQFQRSRATLQAVVNRVGEVVSYAVYAKTTDFRPRFEHGLRVTLNTTTMDDAFEGTSLGANLYCGAHKAGYFEYFGGFNAVEARYFVLGVSDANTTEVSTGAICKAVTGDLAACNFSSRMLACVKSAGVGRRLRSTLRANVYIETAPGRSLLPAMLYPPDEASNLGVGAARTAADRFGAPADYPSAIASAARVGFRALLPQPGSFEGGA